MLQMTLTPNRQDLPRYSRYVKYEDFAGDVRMPITKVYQVVDGRLHNTKVTEISYASIRSEASYDSRIDWRESDRRTGRAGATTRAMLIEQGLVKCAGHSEPTLKLTDDDWVIAARRVAGLDSGEIDGYREDEDEFDLDGLTELCT